VTPVAEEPGTFAILTLVTSNGFVPGISVSAPLAAGAALRPNLSDDVSLKGTSEMSGLYSFPEKGKDISVNDALITSGAFL
jgi:hypothetical protein